MEFISNCPDQKCSIGLDVVEYTSLPIPCALLGPFSIGLSLWGTPLSYSAPRTILVDFRGEGRWNVVLCRIGFSFVLNVAIRKKEC